MKPPAPVRALVHRVGYRVLQVWWFVRRPAMSGVKCAVTDGGRVLLVRHTYGSRSWDLPGGKIRRHEPPLAAARREMHEELGVRIEAWESLGQLQVIYDHRRDTLNCFRAERDGRTITIDRGELRKAKWFDRDALPDDRGQFVDAILARLPHA